MKHNRWIVMLVCCLTAFLVVACGDKDENGKTSAPVTKEDVKKEVHEAKEQAEKAIETTAAYTQQQKDAYLEEISSELDSYEQTLKQLEAKAAEMTGEAKESLDKQIEALQKEQEEAVAKMEELQTASESAWEDLKAGMDNAMNELNESFKEATSHF